MNTMQLHKHTYVRTYVRTYGFSQFVFKNSIIYIVWNLLITTACPSIMQVTLVYQYLVTVKQFMGEDAEKMVSTLLTPGVFRGWADYVAGFGQLKGEHWLGLEKIHCLTTRRPRTELRVDLADFEGNYKYAHYSFFSVGNSGTKYRLDIAGYTGTAGDSLAYHNGMQFSTKDRDNDQGRENCATSWKGAWWYKNCHQSNLNGLYLSGQHNEQGVSWHHFRPGGLSQKFAQMKLRFRD